MVLSFSPVSFPAKRHLIQQQVISKLWCWTSEVALMMFGLETVPVQMGTGVLHSPVSVHSVLDAPSRMKPSLQVKLHVEPRPSVGSSQDTLPSSGVCRAGH